MNQAIQFPDREEWDENKKCVCFPALVNGMQLTCAISGESLASTGRTAVDARRNADQREPHGTRFSTDALFRRATLPRF